MTIHIRPHPRNRKAMAEWLTARPWKVRTLNGGFTFAVDDRAYLGMPQDLLLGAFVEGNVFVPATLPPDTPGKVHEGPFATYTGPAYAGPASEPLLEAPMPPVNLRSAGTAASEGVDGESDDWDDYNDADAFVPPLEDGGTAHVCPICGKQLKNAQGVAVHARHKHPSTPITVEEVD